VGIGVALALAARAVVLALAMADDEQALQRRAKQSVKLEGSMRSRIQNCQGGY